MSRLLAFILGAVLIAPNTWAQLRPATVVASDYFHIERVITTSSTGIRIFPHNDAAADCVGGVFRFYRSGSLRGAETVLAASETGARMWSLIVAHQSAIKLAMLNGVPLENIRPPYRVWYDTARPACYIYDIEVRDLIVP